MEVQVVLKEEEFKGLLKYKEYYDNNFVRFINGKASEIYNYTEDNREIIDNSDVGAYANGLVLQKIVFGKEEEKFVSTEEVNKELNKKFNEVVEARDEQLKMCQNKLKEYYRSYSGLKIWIKQNSKAYHEYKKDFGDIILSKDLRDIALPLRR